MRSHHGRRPPAQPPTLEAPPRVLHFIYLPLGIPHAVRVTGTTPVRFVGFADPGGIFDLHQEVGMPAAERRLPGADGLPMDVEIPRWNEVGPRFGLEVVGPPLPEGT